MEILYGFHPVNEALRAGRRTIETIWVADGKSSRRIEDFAEQAVAHNIPLKRIRSSRLTTLAGTDMHQGICARVTGFPYLDLGEILDRVGRSFHPCLLLLDSILDPHNLGALIRTAYCAGVDGVVIPKDRSATPTPAVSRISAGALEHTRLIRVTNLVTTISILKSAGLWVAGLDRSSGNTLYSIDLTGSLAIVVGSEEKGIRRLVKKQCDVLIAIPQLGSVDSLNASVAGGVVMYEAFRQRQNR